MHTIVIKCSLARQYCPPEPSWQFLGSGELRAFDRAGTQDVDAQELGRPLAIARLDQVEDVQVLARLQGQAAAIYGDPILDEPPQAVHPSDGIHEELVLRAPDEHLMELRVGLEQVSARHALEAAVQDGLLLIPGGPE